MKTSEYKSYDELPLFLNAETVAKVLGIAPSSAYELLHEADFPVLKVGNRMVVPKENLWSGWISTPAEVVFHETTSRPRRLAQAGPASLSFPAPQCGMGVRSQAH